MEDTFDKLYVYKKEYIKNLSNSEVLFFYQFFFYECSFYESYNPKSKFILTLECLNDLKKNKKILKELKNELISRNILDLS